MKLGWANGWRGIVALALLTGAAPTRGQTPQGTSATDVAKEEPKIVAIRIVKEDGQVLSDSPSGIAVEIGKAVDRGKIAESLRTLYRTGDYADGGWSAIGFRGAGKFVFQPSADRGS